MKKLRFICCVNMHGQEGLGETPALKACWGVAEEEAAEFGFDSV